MIIVSIDSIPGSKIQILGLVKGATVQTKHIGSDFMAGFKNLVGGEVKGYTEMLNKSRDIATGRMIAEAEELGADAIIGVRYTSSELMQGAAEIFAYGTAVKIL